MLFSSLMIHKILSVILKTYLLFPLRLLIMFSLFSVLISSFYNLAFKRMTF